MNLLDNDLLNKIIGRNLNEDILQGRFGLEKENIRVDKEGRLAFTPHSKIFGSKKENPYIKTDFSESQIEMITPAFDSIEETFHFLETIHDIITLELKDEYLWPSSNPPILPNEDEIPIADMEDEEENKYRLQLAEKYGRKKQLVSGIHFNFSFQESFLRKLHNEINSGEDFREFKDRVYLKVARNVLKYRWLLIYLTGVSPIFHQTYAEKCVQLGNHFDQESYYFPNMNSLRNSVCGYRNEKPLYVSFDSIEEYVYGLENLVRSQELLSAKEFYSCVRLKSAKGQDQLQALLENGIDYLELRTTDLNPFDKIGISKETMTFNHLFLITMFLIKDEPFGEEEQRLAQLNQDILTLEGITARQYRSDEYETTLQKSGLEIIENMGVMIQQLTVNDETYARLLEQKQRVLVNPDLSFAEQLKSEIKNSTYLMYHLEKAKKYAEESAKSGYKFFGYEDLELSTQLLLKAAIKRGIQFEILDREDNFILLKKGEHHEYVKQATKTSLDSYITFLIMENKIVTKKVLGRHGVRVPKGNAYNHLKEALNDFEVYQGKPIVIKPKSTNFGLGITIFTTDYSKDDYYRAFEMAFEHDQTVLLEEFLTGKEYRFLVMGDEVVGVLHRVPANVAGDGIQTIEQLVTEKNKDPLRSRGYKTPLEFIQLGEVEEMFLKNQKKNRTYIPTQGEIVYLRENSNISTGGDSIDFTDEIPESYKKIAIRSAKAAGAVFCGVDMVIDNINEEAKSTNYGIIEINFNPAIHIHCYPYKGKNRKADEKIVDLLFGNK
ncbi:MAG TPA: bifunctional glutamate--cysteine ligase GshA/glutathione synthetase GshB [Bacillales bacterium]|nr:bifunctional glutamate--cysteine ligase GshA/glutathione synthetase GshB [Bacillales bacterium]